MFSFGKKERLCNKATIERLYGSPRRTLVFPLSVHWMLVDDPAAERLQVLIVAPKKKLRHAVDRNRTKRIMRECYRLRKGALQDILASQDRRMVIAFNYIHTTPPDYHKLGASFDKVIEQLATQLRESGREDHAQ